MKETNLPRHWLGPEELQSDYWNDPKVREKRGQEFHDKPIETMELIEKLDEAGLARREFLTLMGASMALATFACARRPVHKIIPYVVKPEEITAGVANYYTTACPETGAGILAKVREGRPVKLEGLPEHPINRGSLSARSQAHILDLYDADRAQGPRRGDRKSGSISKKQTPTWAEIDTEVVDKIKATQGRFRILSDRISSESLQKLTSEFLGNERHLVQVDPFSSEDLITAQMESYGSEVVPHYVFSNADLVVSFGMDFLGVDPSAESYAADWVKKRKLSSANPEKQEMSKLVVFESQMTLTGANADRRYPVKHGDELRIVAALCREVAALKGAFLPAEVSAFGSEASLKDLAISVEEIKALAHSLSEKSGTSLVLGGGLAQRSEYQVALQVAVNFLNSTLSNEGRTIDGNAKAFSQIGHRWSDLERLVSDMNAGQVDVLVVHALNPLYTLPAALGFEAALKKVPLVISVTDREDETALRSDYLYASNHFLESWGDVRVRPDVWSIQQPMVSPLHDTRGLGDILIEWTKRLGYTGRGALSTVAASETPSFYEYLKKYSKDKYLKSGSFDKEWEDLLRKGFVVTEKGSPSARGFRTSSWSRWSSLKSPTSSSDIHLSTYLKSSLGDGRRANNPWLQEMPDPISTATWDNYANLSPKLAERLGIKKDDIVEIKVEDGATLELPALIQPGLADYTVAVAVGYGRTAAGRVGNGVGRNILGFARTRADGPIFSGIPVKLRNTGKRYQLATTQWHFATENRPIINDLTLSEFKANPGASAHTDPHMKMENVPTMWPKFKYPGYRWGMAVDLNACTGCGACIIACQAENNTPVVGRDNVRKSREMHWLRIDRYYSGSLDAPSVVFQPMMCQHCENAPCETVCPVLATVHDDEGLNSQVYNRCVGTRYCQNNCPYKVRRFNFFDHWKSYEGTMNLAWNPDVTVRTRGIMEKCTFCVQRIRDSKDLAKDEGRKIKDGELKTACQQTCATDAIVFGNLNDPESRVVKLAQEKHAFRVLEVLNTVPSVSYLSKVRNVESSSSDAHGGKNHHA